MKLAYLYRRFSDITQSKGTSLTRQSKLANDWCKANNAKLADVKTDKGVSAYKGKHAAIGALSEVLRSIGTGEIKEGSYLLIENIDRLGRDQITIAQARLTDILNAGVNVVTLQDGKIFTRDSLNDVGDIIWMIVSMARANEESRTKSSRAYRTWEIKKEQIENGYRPKFKSPVWLDYDDETKQYVHNEKAKVVRQIFDIYLNCLSINKTAKELNNLEVSTFRHAPLWANSSVRAIINSKSTYGFLDLPDIQKAGFYPPVITEDEFYKAQSIKSRNNEKRTAEGQYKNGEYSNLLSGIAKCGVCGANLYMHGKERLTAAGHIENYKYLSCSVNRNSDKENKCSLPNFRYKNIEIILAFLSTNFDLLPSSGDKKENKGYLKAQIDAYQAKLDEVMTRESNLLDLMIASPSDMLTEKHKEIVNEKVSIEGCISEAKIKIANLGMTDDMETAGKMFQTILNKLGDETYRRKFAAMLDRTIDECVFNENKSINMTVMGHEIFINRIENVIDIVMPENVATLTI